jgi:preprotein translocase subunit SecE
MSKTKKKEISDTSAGQFAGIKTYLKGVQSEWGKITWPEKNQIFQETMVVLFVVAFFTAIVLVLDLIFKDVVFNGLLWLVKHFNG